MFVNQGVIFNEKAPDDMSGVFSIIISLRGVTDMLARRGGGLSFSTRGVTSSGHDVKPAVTQSRRQLEPDFG